MNRVLRTDHGTFELVARNAPSSAFRAIRFLDSDEALRLLRTIAAEPAAMAALRAWAQDAGLGPAQDGPLLSQLATALAAGRLRITRDNRLPEGTGPGVPGSPRTPRPAPSRPPTQPPPGRVDPPRPPPGPEIITELVVRVRDADGAPVADANVSAGALGERTTDKDGVANYGRVRPGTYDISAEKPGHSPTRTGRVGMDEEKKVNVPAGSRTDLELVQHPQCPNVAWFEGPADGRPYRGAGRRKYFGFDHKTNMPVTAFQLSMLKAFSESTMPYLAGALPKDRLYWDPVPDKCALTLDPGRLAGDGTPWVSVGLGHEVELEINFAFKDGECEPCIGNTTFDFDNGAIAQVLTARVTKNKAAFRIKGTGTGEATLMVRCQGCDLGRFHIWCRRIDTLQVDVVNVVTNNAAAAEYHADALAVTLKHIYRAALLDVDLRDLGTVDLSGNLLLRGMELISQDSPAVLRTIHGLVELALWRRPADAPQARSLDQAYRLYYYVPTGGPADVLGDALQIGNRYSFTFYDGLESHGTAAHELGHSLGLHHPLHDPPPPATGRPTQFAPHVHLSLGNATGPFAATNTEPASEGYGGLDNVMARDPTNVMGYWPFRTQRHALRYHQWIAVRRS